MNIDLFSKAEPSWISSPEVDLAGDPITLYSSIRAMRNIDGFPFPNKCSKPQLYDSAALLLGEIGSSNAWGGCDFRMIDSLDPLSKNLLLEARAITPLMAAGGPGRFFLRDASGTASCMINEEDHMSISVTEPGLKMEELKSSMESLLKPIKIKTAHDAILGHLTANPDNVGSGVRASVLMHLPALDATDDIRRILSLFERDWKGLALYKLLSDQNNTSGSFYLLSNRKTLGIDTKEILEFVGDAAGSIVSKEMFARHKILNIRSADMKDRFWRAWGLLRHARKLSFAEAINKFSFVKLGSDLGILPKIAEREWRSMVIGTQRYHMRVSCEMIAKESDEPVIRASMFRQFIERLGSAAKADPSDLHKEL